MRSAIGLTDIVGVGQHLLLEAVMPLHCNLDADLVDFALEVNHVMQLFATLVDVRDK